MTSAIFLALASTAGIWTSDTSSTFYGSNPPPSLANWNNPVGVYAPAQGSSIPAASSAAPAATSISSPAWTPSSSAQALSPAPARNPAPIGVYVDFATGPDEAATVLGVAPADPSRPLGSSWYTSPVVTHVFGGAPTLDQQQQFKQAVLDGLNRDYAAAGLPVSFSTNPSGAVRELGILSNASSPQNPNAIGLGAENGRDAVTFLDSLGFATDEQRLVNALRHNGDHEIGHTLGMEHTPADGFINSAVVSTTTLTQDLLTFTPEALQVMASTVEKLQTQGIGNSGDLGAGIADVGGQTLQTPEPASWLVLSTIFGIALSSRNLLPTAISRSRPAAG